MGYTDRVALEHTIEGFCGFVGEDTTTRYYLRKRKEVVKMGTTLSKHAGMLTCSASEILEYF